MTTRGGRVDNGFNSEMATIKDAAERMMLEKKLHVKESTYSIYLYCIERHIIPDLGKMRLSEITEVFLNDYLREKLNNGRVRGRGELSWKTVSDLRSLIGCILDYAARNGYPELSNIRMMLPKKKSTPIQVFTVNEQRTLTQFLISDLNPVHLGILISLYDGLRIGEICGLRWGDIDFYYGTLRVERTVSRVRDTELESGGKTKLVITDPKTYHSMRTIPVPHDLLLLLEKNKRDSETYILTGTNHYMEPRSLLAHFKSALREAGLHDHYHFHALRHTFASRCVEEEFDVKSLSEILGHSNVKITMDRYVHPSMEYKKEQMNRLTLP